MPDRVECQTCGVWCCARCGWQRPNANRSGEVMQYCHQCGSKRGRWHAVKHKPGTTAWRTHMPTGHDHQTAVQADPDVACPPGCLYGDRGRESARAEREYKAKIGLGWMQDE